jgi:putative transposase
VFAQWRVGVREFAEVRFVCFWDFDPGFFDEDCGRVEPAVNPFLPAKV